MLQRQIDLGVDVERAFGLWTEHVNLWWPAGHSISQHPGVRMAFEARLGGRLLERVPEGPEIVWGRVVGWQAPSSIRYAFSPGGGGEYTSDVQVSFVARPGGSQLNVRHERGQFTADRWESMQGRFEQHWDLVLPAFEEHSRTTDLPTGGAGDTLF